VAALLSACDAVPEGYSTASMNGRDFVQKAWDSNSFEIYASQIAQDRATSREARAFARRMLDDHTHAEDELRRAAMIEGVPAPAPSLDAKHSAMLDELRRSYGRDFDVKFIDMQQQAHEEAVSLFGFYAAHGEDGALKDFARRTLPKLEDHRAVVTALR
jgi:putative membrane protein